MNPIRLAIERPVAVLAIMLMAVLFGLVALSRIPVQLTPDVNRPAITVRTNWSGASPAEIEREIVNRQEDVLAGVAGLVRMESSAQDGRASVQLEFQVGTDLDRAMLLVANRLDRVGDYPDEADEPRLSTSGTDDNPIAWFVLTRLPGNERPIHQYSDFVDDVVVERFERVPGIGGTNVYAEASRELQIRVEPDRLARYGLTVPDVAAVLRAANISASAGDVEEGKRRYIVRTEGELNDPGRVRAVVLRSLDDAETGRLGRVTVGDVATVELAYGEPGSFQRFRGVPAMGVSAIRETGANVIETMAGLRAAAAELNDGPLPAAGLSMRQTYDETVYIESAIDLVVQNIYVGGTLAALVLLLFLRSWRATLVVAMAIPISVIATFVAMSAFGRSLNVISLAGIAFAVGMVVDAAIVVLENIFRLRERGLAPAVAAYEGARQVWGAVLVSALTTVMVFVPLLVMELEVGQLFRDIAVAISVAVLLSLLVAVTVVPALARQFLARSVTHRLSLPAVDRPAGYVSRLIERVAKVTVRRRAVGLALVGLIVAGTALFATVFLPKLEYLPEGNRNLIFGLIQPPPGYNLQTTFDIAARVEQASKPLWLPEHGGAPASADTGEGPPRIDNFMFVASRNNTFISASSADPGRVGELIEPLSDPVFEEPGTFGFLTQPSIFGRGVGGARAVDLDIRGPDLIALLDVATRAAARIGEVLPRSAGHQLRPRPGLELGNPEIRLYPDAVRLADAGVSAGELAQTVDALNDGLRIAEVTVDGQRLDLVLSGPHDGAGQETQSIGSLPVVTPSGLILPAEALADVVITAGPTEVRHAERQRTVTLQVRPAGTMPLEAVIEVLERDVVAPLVAEGVPPGVAFEMSGTADKLTETWQAMRFDLFLALVIVYLVMAILFESFIYPLVIMVTVPVASAGGIAGLAVLNLFTYQALDMLTLLGFVILIGIVVNNAILLVEQTLFHLRAEGLAVEDAILEATRNRIRPIFMTTLTSVVGMLPLVVFPGAGSELYRGLGSVVVGGLMLSAALTLLMVPPLLGLCLGAVRRLAPSIEPAVADGPVKPVAAE